MAFFVDTNLTFCQFYDKISVVKGDIMNKNMYPSDIKPWKKYYENFEENFVVPQESAFMLLEKSANKMPNNIAINYMNFKLTFKKYIDKIINEASSLKKLGVKKGEIVPVFLPNIPEARTTIYALNIVGAIAYPINPLLPPKEFEKILIENNVKNLFMFNMFYQKYMLAIQNSSVENVIMTYGTDMIPKYILKFKNILDNLKKGKRNTLIPDSVISWDEFIISKSKENIKPIYEKNQTSVIIGTSGTTGTPKGVCLTNENLNSMALEHLNGSLNFKPGDKMLDILIPSIGYGLSVMHYEGVCGLETILIPTLQSDIYPLLKKYKPDHFAGGPIHYENLVSYHENDPIIYGKNFVSGGASLPKTIEKKLNKIKEDDTFEENNVFVRQGLGCTENGGASTYAKKGAYKPYGVGIPLLYETVGIFKPGTDVELGFNTDGEICINGPTVMKEYLNNEEETNKVLKKHNDGKIWLHTADIGYMDEDGQIFIKDRIKNIFARRGFNVHPNTVADFISSLPIVEKAFVMGINHPDEQMVPVAFIKLKEEMPLKEAENIINENCYQFLEETSIPYEIVFVSDLPLNLGGKVDTKKLLELSQIDYFKNKEKSFSRVLNIPKY
jgi:long-chain-fatty-acid--coA ligase